MNKQTAFYVILFFTLSTQINCRAMKSNPGTPKEHRLSELKKRSFDEADFDTKRMSELIRDASFHAIEQQILLLKNKKFTEKLTEPQTLQLLNLYEKRANFHTSKGNHTDAELDRVEVVKIENELMLYKISHEKSSHNIVN